MRHILLALLLAPCAYGAVIVHGPGSVIPVNSHASVYIMSNSTDGGTTFVNSCQSGLTVSTTGSVAHEVDQIKFGTSSIYFPAGSGYDSLNVSDSPLLDPGVFDFTLSFWAYRHASQSGPCLPFARADVIDLNADPWSYRIWWDFGSGGTIGTYATTANGSWTIINGTSAGTWTASTWTHMLLVRRGVAWKFFKNGTLQWTDTSASVADATPMAAYNYASILRDLRFGSSGTSPTKCYMDAMLIQKGVAARWSSNFTPPTRP